MDRKFSPHVLVFGDKVFGRSSGLEEVLRVGPCGRIRALIWQVAKELAPCLHVETHSKVAICKAGGKLAPESNQLGTLISDFGPPEL